ncbi:hypothetical protein OAT84_02205 [Gammaproteobacteria bacterium]|nr:hypothetical protein [Gammaproteobacteria bacterium]
MAKSIQIMSALCILGWSNTSIEKWTEYRLAEMFSVPSQSEDLERFFTSDAYNAYQESLNQSFPSENHGYHIVLDQFISPIKVSDAEDGKYAQASFILSISNQYSSWNLPVEMILTINTDNGYKISHFEGITANPTNLKEYEKDRLATCPKKD